jgi:hypothetical protein
LGNLEGSRPFCIRVEANGVPLGELVTGSWNEEPNGPKFDSVILPLRVKGKRTKSVYIELSNRSMQLKPALVLDADFLTLKRVLSDIDERPAV